MQSRSPELILSGAKSCDLVIALIIKCPCSLRRMDAMNGCNQCAIESLKILSSAEALLGGLTRDQACTCGLIFARRRRGGRGSRARLIGYTIRSMHSPRRAPNFKSLFINKCRMNRKARAVCHAGVNEAFLRSHMMGESLLGGNNNHDLGIFHAICYLFPRLSLTYLSIYLFYYYYSQQYRRCSIEAN